MAEMANLSEPSIEVATTLAEDTSYRLRQIITRALKFMRHSNRVKLTCADINKALKWSDSQPVYGHECNPNRPLICSYSPDAQVFSYNSDNDNIDLIERRQNHSKIDDLLTEELLSEAVPDMSVNNDGMFHIKVTPDITNKT